LASIIERKNNKGETRYKVVIRKKGFPTQTATFKTKKAARRWATNTESAIDEGRHFRRMEGKRKTFAELVDAYLDTVAPVRHADPIANRAIRKHLSWWKQYLGAFVLNDVTPARISKLRDRLLASPATKGGGGSKKTSTGKVKTKAPATVVRYLASLSVCFSTAVDEWEWLDENPVKKVRRPKQNPGRVRFLSEEERPRLLDACQDSACDYLYPIVIIALSTGARYSEILHLRWRDIDLERGVARLEKTKNQERRALPLTHLALEQVKLLRSALEEAPEPKAFVFARADGKAPMEIRKHWYAAVEKAGIEDFRFHDLRHSAASYLAMNGATLAEIAEVLGHKTLQMVKRYAHLSDQHTAKVVERMNRSIFPANDNEPEEEASADEASG